MAEQHGILYLKVYLYGLQRNTFLQLCPSIYFITFHWTSISNFSCKINNKNVIVKVFLQYMTNMNMVLNEGGFLKKIIVKLTS